MNKRFSKSAIATVTALTITFGMINPAISEAGSIFGDVLGSVISGAVAMKQINSQINELDNEGRYEFYAQLRKKNGVNYEQAPNAMLDRVMSRLSNVIVKYDPTVVKKPYNYFVNNDKSFNAFCTLGHNVSVNIGLFNTLNYQEDEIAFVIGHELAHGTHSDPANGVKKQVGMKILTDVAVSSVGGGALASLGGAVIGNLGTAKGITLPMEKRADEDAFVYCSEAGYNVGAGAAVWQRIIERTANKDAATSKINQLFNPSDHPKHVNRRDTYSKTITEYSNKAVVINNENGEISVNKIVVGTPAAAFGQSGHERAYMVAGDIASVYHEYGNIPQKVYISNGAVCLGNRTILTITDGDDANAWVENLRKANKVNRAKKK